MSLTLTVDGERWRATCASVAEATPGLVPVAKGNGYGLTLGRLARKTQWLPDQGLRDDTLAVGTYDELPQVAVAVRRLRCWCSPRGGRSVPLSTSTRASPRVVHTVSRVDDLRELLARQPDARFVLERLTTMLRHGITPRELREAARWWPPRGPAWRASPCTCRSRRARTCPRCSGR